MPRAQTRYGLFEVLDNDLISQTLLSGHHFEGEIIDRLLSLIDPKKHVIDIGANLGTHSIPYGQRLSQCSSGGRLLAFEPQTRLAKLLKENLQLNHISATVYEVALGHREMVTSLGDSYELHGQLHRLGETQGQHNYGGIGLGEHGPTVLMKTLDAFSFSPVGFIKLDVEGAEKLVLWGGRETIKRERPIIFFEHHLNHPVFEEKWREISRLLGLEERLRNLNIFDLLLGELGYSRIERVDQVNYLAYP